MQKDWIDRMSDENKALKTTIARLTTERDEARKTAKAAYEVLTLTRRAGDLREVYHSLPNAHNRIGDKRSRKGHARDAWLRAFRKADREARAILARLTTERDEARKTAKAAYERAARISVLQFDSFGDGFDRPLSSEAQEAIRALATEAETDALAEMLDAETRACAGVARAQFDDRGRGRAGHPSEMDWTDGYDEATRGAQAAILARIDQRKEATP